MIAPTTPLVLLDVDGVINDLGHLMGHARPWETRIIEANGFQVHIPEYMPLLVQTLARATEIHWCTTWRSDANRAIAPALGVGPFPVVDDGTAHQHTEWKPAAAYRVAADAIGAGRRVIWIEDFYDMNPATEMPPDVEYVDTTDVPGGPVLLPELLPPDLQSLLD